MKLLIQLTDLAIQAKAVELLQPLSFKLYQDQPITILGQTGSGKSLLAQAIIGLLPVGLSQTGTIQVFGQSHTHTSLKSLWGKQMIMLPQEPWRALDPLMPAYKQITEVYECVKGQSAAEAFNHAISDLEQAGLKNSALKRVGQLSGGMAQRLAITAATAGGAKLILADEPTKGLDVNRRDDMVALLLEKSKGGGLLTITHDIEVARQIGGTIIVMKEGVVVEQGAAEQVLEKPQHAYTQALIAADPHNWTKITTETFTQRPILKVENLAIGRHGQSLSEAINFTIHQGEVVGIVGDSGCGKSTLGDTLLGLLPPLKGKITQCKPNSQPHQWLKLFQDPPSAFTASVTLGTLLNDLVKLHHLNPLRIAPLMQKLKLSAELLKRKSTQVSGGELQRFAILRALLLDPIFLFADEPTSRLDPIIAKEVIDILINLTKQQGCALMLVSHDPDLIEKRCDSVIRLN